jgi:hypothetical protein
MKKIGILTFHRGPNFGGFLQAYHLRAAIRSLGYDADIINYQNTTHRRYENPILSARWTPRGLTGAFRRLKKARPFREPVASLSTHPFTTVPQNIDWTSFDTIVVGSDVVWDFSSPQYGADPCFFGMHPSQRSARFVSYAASCGTADAGRVPDYVREGIRRFEAVGVRDRKTLELALRCGGPKPVLVADPTWLRDDPSIEWNDAPKRPYVLVYGGALTSREDDLAVHRWAKGNGLDLISAASPAPSADRRYQTLTPFQWVDLYRNATAVVTATLHGLLYAVKFRKPFVMKLLPQTRDKAATTLERIECMERVFPIGTGVASLDLDRLLTTPPNVPPVVTSEFVGQSMNFLRTSLVG